jgi:hypothetical protein
MAIQGLAIACSQRVPAARFEIGESHDEDEHAADRSEPGRGPSIGLEERRGDQVLNLWAARQRIHRERKGAQSDRAGNQPLGNIALPEHFGGERIDRKDHDKQRHAAVRENRAHQHDREHRALRADQPHG